MNDRKYNNIQIAEIVFFSEDLHGVVIRDENVILSDYRYEFLASLVRAKGRVVSSEIIAENIRGSEYEDTLPEQDNEMIKQTLKGLRKILGDNGSEQKIIVTEKGVGYRLRFYREVNDSVSENKTLPIVLTSRMVPNATTESILFREEELSFLLRQLNSMGAKAIMLHGFGGVGKTSLARLLYSKIKYEYDSSGWFEYHKNLKETITEGVDLTLFKGAGLSRLTKLEDKWLFVSDRIKNSSEKKLIIIDNVDFDNEIAGHWGQAPMSSTQGQLKICYQKDDITKVAKKLNTSEKSLKKAHFDRASLKSSFNSIDFEQN